MADWIVLDSNVVIALAAKEADKYSTAEVAIDAYVNSGARMIAPGVLLAECLFVLCKKAEDGTLSPAEHTSAVKELASILSLLDALPTDENLMAERAASIRGQFGCSRSSDAIFIAVAEELSNSGTVDIVTFDGAMARQVGAAAPAVTVNLLVPGSP